MWKFLKSCKTTSKSRESCIPLFLQSWYAYKFPTTNLYLWPYCSPRSPLAMEIPCTHCALHTPSLGFPDAENERSYAQRWFQCLVSLRKHLCDKEPTSSMPSAICIHIHAFPTLHSVRPKMIRDVIDQRTPCSLTKIICSLYNLPLLERNQPIIIHSIFSIRDSVIFCLGTVPYYFQNVA